MNKGQKLRSRSARSFSYHHFMSIAMVLQSRVTLPTTRTNSAAWLNCLLLSRQEWHLLFCFEYYGNWKPFKIEVSGYHKRIEAIHRYFQNSGEMFPAKCFITMCRESYSAGRVRLWKKNFSTEPQQAKKHLGTGDNSDPPIRRVGPIHGFAARGKLRPEC